MAFLEKDLSVKTSTLPNAGKGLFTNVFIPKGTRIVEYKGKRTTWKIASKDVDNGYIFHIDDEHVLDAKNYKSSHARYANDAAGLSRIKGLNNNAEYTIEDDNRVYIDAKKDIPAGSEIFVSYSKEYWDVIRANIKIDNDKTKAKTKKATKK
jgi:SET domain-containing protein